MRVNEYNKLSDFTNEYVGVWSPSEKHWYGLDFKYLGVVYRLNTGSMYNESNTILSDGRMALFSLYRLSQEKKIQKQEYELLGEYADMHDLLESKVIHGLKFSEVIMDETTEILGKD